MYSIKSEDGEKNTLKGVSKSYVKKNIKHKDYINCLHKKTLSIANQIWIAQDSHKLFTIKQSKIALTPFDDKRFILEDGIHSRAYGHFKNEEN